MLVGKGRKEDELEGGSERKGRRARKEKKGRKRGKGVKGKREWV